MRILLGFLLGFICLQSFAQTKFAIGYLPNDQLQNKTIENIRIKYSSDKNFVIELHPKIFNSELIALAMAGQINVIILPMPEAISLFARSFEWRIVGRFSNSNKDNKNIYLLIVELNFLNHKLNECQKMKDEIFAQESKKTKNILFNETELKEIEKLELSIQRFDENKILVKDFIAHDFLK